MSIELTEEVLHNIDLRSLGNLVVEEEFRNYFLDNPGKEHYPLLAYLSTQFHGVNLLDIGTYKGCSALALSYNTSNTVHSFDIGNFRNLHEEPDNIKFYIGYVTDEEYVDLIKSSPFIMLDTAHDGTFEHAFHKHLQEIKWEGILLLDDINLNTEMKTYWTSINELKFDISPYGHWSGTGIVYFGEGYEFT
jgi:hypothetical protein